MTSPNKKDVVIACLKVNKFDAEEVSTVERCKKCKAKVWHSLEFEEALRKKGELQEDSVMVFVCNDCLKTVTKENPNVHVMYRGKDGETANRKSLFEALKAVFEGGFK